MAQKRCYRLKLACAAAVFALTAASPSSVIPGHSAMAPGAVLIRIEKSGSDIFPAGLIGKVLGVSELESCWLAVVERPALGSLSRAADGFTVLDEHLAEKAYFLVRIKRPNDIAELARFGEARALEPRTALFRPISGATREILPARFKSVRVKFVSDPDLLSQLAAPHPPAPIRVPEREAALAPNPVISQLTAQVSKTRLTASILDLQNFQTRYASTNACEQSGTYLYDAFARLGLQTEYDPFRFNSNRSSSRNIVATLPGATTPGREVVICAHYDSYSNSASTLAPGADDNGSGTAAVLEIARVLAGSSIRFDFTIRFVCCSAEEWNLDGSAHFAQDARNRGADVAGVITMDMIAYPNASVRNMDVVTNRSSEWLADRFVTAVLTYEGLTVRKVVDNSWKWSDQSSFWDNGFSALCGLENEDSSNPYYHKTTDVLGTLNLDYGTSLTRAFLAAAAELARPVIVSGKFNLTIQAEAGGTTIPAPGVYAYDTGALVPLSALAAADHRFNGWSGDAAGPTNPVMVTMNSDKTVAATFLRIIHPPADLQGRKVLNRSLGQAEYINELSWTAPPGNAGLSLSLVRIFRSQGGTLTRVAEASSGQTSYRHRSVEKDTAYDYVVFFIGSDGREGDPAYLTVR